MPPLPDDWWPDFIPPLVDAQFVHGDHLTVAEISQPTGSGSYRQVFSALALPDVAERILTSPGSIGYEVSATGPHLSVRHDDEPGGYDPKFWIFGGEAAPDGLEPLVVSWNSAITTLLRIDHGFVMTYGLVPRQIPVSGTKFDESWDDLEGPRLDIVNSRPISKSEYRDASHAWVYVHREYLGDYAFLRGQCILQVVYGHADGYVAGDALDALRATKSAQLFQPGREVVVHLNDEEGKVHVRYWAVRLLLAPERPSVSAGYWDYGNLHWPGMAEPVTDPHRMPGMDYVYVTDDVLGRYEGREDEGFQVNPERGAVHYHNQWAVGYIHRIGRDLLQLEVRKLYEGGRPEEVRHWHEHAVDPVRAYYRTPTPRPYSVSFEKGRLFRLPAFCLNPSSWKLDAA